MTWRSTLGCEPWWLEGTWRGGGHLIAGTDLSQSLVSLPEGEFTTTETSCRLEYAFDTRKDLLAFVQFNNEDQRIDFNLRFHWIPVIGDDVFVVWNSGYSSDTNARYPVPHSGSLTHPLNGALVVKIAHRIAL